MTATAFVQRSFPEPFDQVLIDKLLSKWSIGDERCGVILVGGTILELTNGMDDPSHSFGLLQEEIEDVFRAYGKDSIAAVWHTHPNNKTRPSEEDREGWPTGSLRYLIVTQSEVAEWANPFDRLY
ncbi:tail protein [Gordonia phage Terapin]|uniref:JAB domain-containing protein n=5 Tax=Terapinvirus terapin TaxID=2734283 RepID=A0A345MB48_9CAUD|nr:tail protein [Gordonia phage Terapin]AVP43285.1 hypothetical protein PBI_DJOKOVIC_8 [Gordonia phage Djokovic]AXH67719.1 hypothetical protein SEA_BEYONCAGE_8 [Gordonia phage Beyoncage]QOC56153.1 metalloprotease [Gordonia phage Sienna]QOC56578.1 metalloprotease [Gordonia phage BiteSize]QYW00811.1 metalloprotease [Gordonia phage Madi]